MLNAILLFSKRGVKHLNTTKLSKLLFFFDFTHVKQAGYPAIGLQYYAFKNGPVPKDFWLEIKDGNVPEDFKNQLALFIRRDEFSKEKEEVSFKGKTDPDMKVFTPRERKILETLTEIYQDATASQMSEISHLKNQPWDLTYNTKGENKPIDYDLAIDAEVKDRQEEIRQSLREHFEIVRNFELSPAG